MKSIKNRYADRAPAPDDLFTFLSDRLANHPANSLLGFSLEAVRELYACLRLTHRDAITNGPRSHGTIHGGIVAALADTAAAFALSTAFEGRMSFATVDLHITYLARAKNTILAHAVVIRRGARINVCEVKITDESDTLVATATVNFILTKPTEPKS
ncbi:MAG TPA: PaaI family thioesterase [bacterium]|nr:PaaI family thioesterase [bacterium]